LRHVEGENTTGGSIAGRENGDVASTAIAAAAHSTSILETDVLDLFPLNNFRFPGKNSRLNGDRLTSECVMSPAPDCVEPEGGRPIVPNSSVGSRRGG
jgi:hypothetical protein